MRRISWSLIVVVIAASPLLLELQSPAQAQQSTARPAKTFLFPGLVIGTLTIKLDWHDANDAYIGNTAVFSESNTTRNVWTLASGSAVAPANAAYVNVYFDYFGVLNSCIEVDDVSLLGLVPDGSYIGEILSNGGFESGDFSDWPGVSTGGVPATVLSGSAHSGNFYARTGQFLYTKHYNVMPSTAYSLSAWYKTITCVQYQYLPLIARQ